MEEQQEICQTRVEFELFKVNRVNCYTQVSLKKE